MSIPIKNIRAERITGSLDAIGINISGSLSGSFSGSLQGTASFSSTASFLNSTTNAFIQNGNSFGTTALLGTNDNQSLALETNGSTRMFISSSGNVGIGTTSPSEKLEVSGNIKATGFKTPSGTANQALTADGDVYDLDYKVDISTTPSSVYATDASGNQVMKPISEFQTDISGKLDKVITAGVERVYTINADGSQGTKATSNFKDVLEFANFASFPTTGESGKIYVALNTNVQYRWSGSAYVQIGGSKRLFILQTDIAFGATTASSQWWTYPREGLRIATPVFYIGSYDPVLETYGEGRCLRWTLPFNCRLIDANFKYSTLTNPMRLNVFSFKQNDIGNIFQGKTIASKLFPSDNPGIRIFSYTGSEIDTDYNMSKGDNITLCANFNGLAAGGIRVNCLTLVFEEI